jgi:hypothetical protein
VDGVADHVLGSPLAGGCHGDSIATAAGSANRRSAGAGIKLRHDPAPRGG